MTTTTDPAELIAHLGLTWTAPKEVNTKRGPRLVQNAEPTEAFWNAWRNDQALLRGLGLSVSKDLYHGGDWRVTWWQEIPRETQEQRAANLAGSRAASSDFDPPHPEGLAYMPFQRAGLDFAKDKPAVYFGEEMGLGKTIEAIGVINLDPSLQRILVVTKASLKENWRRELEKWLVVKRQIGIAHGQYWPRTPVVIVNYDVLSKHHHALRAQPWDLIILDESANIKNLQAKRTLAIIGHTPSKVKQAAGEPVIPRLQARRRLCLSGTPIENRPEEIWTALNFLDPERWGNFYSFARRYCGMINNGYGVDTSGATNLDELQKILRETLLIRRLKKDVLKELPPKTRMVVEMDTEGLEDVIAADKRAAAKHADELEKAQVAMELARAVENDEEFKAAVHRLRSVQLPFAEIAKARHDTAVAKVPALIELIKEDLDDAGKLLIFGHHRDVLHPLHEAFPGSVLITGETPAEKRQGICDQFQQDPNCRIFFGATRACGEGLNLTAAKMVVFVEQDWAPGKLCQAEDRAHRIGQRDNVLVKHYVLPETIDAKMIKTTVAKQEVIDQALDQQNTVEYAEEPVFAPYKPTGKRKELLDEGLLITSGQRAAILFCLQRLAQMCDGAFQLDGHGFSKIDAGIGHSLASQGYLSPGQSALGRRICRKYVKQLGEDAVKAMG